MPLNGQGPRHIRTAHQAYRPDPSYRGACGGDNRAEERELAPSGTPCQIREPQEQPQQFDPPSRDKNRPKKNQSLRGPTDRKPGGQPGHKGNTLKMTADPDLVVELRPDYCRNCGSSLAKLPSAVEKSRQIVDIPPMVQKHTGSDKGVDPNLIYRVVQRGFR